MVRQRSEELCFNQAKFQEFKDLQTLYGEAALPDDLLDALTLGNSVYQERLNNRSLSLAVCQG